MKDIEFRLNQLEAVNQEREDHQTMQKLKEKLHPVMADIEKRLIALETRPVETSVSNVSFTEENPTTLTTLIERVQVWESRVNFEFPFRSVNKQALIWVQFSEHQSEVSCGRIHWRHRITHARREESEASHVHQRRRLGWPYTTYDNQLQQSEFRMWSSKMGKWSSNQLDKQRSHQSVRQVSKNRPKGIGSQSPQDQWWPCPIEAVSRWSS